MRAAGAMTGTPITGTLITGTLITGTLITVAPVAGPIGHLLRTAIDAEQVGATRLHLHADQPEPQTAIAGLREHTRLIVTSDITGAGADVVGSGFVDVILDDDRDLPHLVSAIAELVATNPAGIAIAGRGLATMPALLAALAAGGHLWVGAPAAAAAQESMRPSPQKDHAALVARASGLARIAGRPPLDRRASSVLLGLC